MSFVSRTGLAALAILVGTPALAAAHLRLDSPTPRLGPLELKERHCGKLNSVRGTNVTVLAPGSMLEVRWTETVDHPGHYRISLDLDGQDFTIPLGYNDTTQSTNVVMDLIPDRAGNMLVYRQMIQLPNTTCENCTLQVIQMMTRVGTYNANTDLYFQCADIAIRTPGGVDAGTDGPVGSPDAGEGADAGIGATDLTGGCGCGTSRSQPSGIAALVLAIGIATRRRRRH